MSVRLSRLVAASCLVAGSLLFAAQSASGSLAAEPGPAVDKQATLRLVSDPTAEDPASKLDAYAQNSLADTYGGLVVTDEATESVDVYLTSLDPAVESDLTSRFGSNAKLNFIVTPHSRAEQYDLHNRLASLYGSLLVSGIQLDDFWPDIRDGLEHVGVLTLTAAAERTLDDLLGAANIHVFQTPPAVDTASRTYDYSPWTSGDAVMGDPARGQGCSSSFGISFGGTNKIVTASHCFYNYQLITNNLCDGDCYHTIGNGNALGYVGYRDTRTNGFDEELIQAAPSPSYWFGAPDGHSSITALSGYQRNLAGWTVSNNGAYSGSVYSKVDSIDHCISIEWDNGTFREICGLVLAFNSDGSIANETGDSGGIVTHYDATTQTHNAVGTVSASLIRVPSCRYNTVQDCFQDIYYTGAQKTLDYYNASMVVGP